MTGGRRGCHDGVDLSVYAGGGCDNRSKDQKHEEKFVLAENGCGGLAGPVVAVLDFYRTGCCAWPLL